MRSRQGPSPFSSSEPWPAAREVRGFIPSRFDRLSTVLPDKGKIRRPEAAEPEAKSRPVPKVPGLTCWGPRVPDGKGTHTPTLGKPDARPLDRECGEGASVHDEVRELDVAGDALPAMFRVDQRASAPMRPFE